MTVLVIVLVGVGGLTRIPTWGWKWFGPLLAAVPLIAVTSFRAFWVSRMEVVEPSWGQDLGGLLGLCGMSLTVTLVVGRSRPVRLWRNVLDITAATCATASACILILELSAAAVLHTTMALSLLALTTAVVGSLAVTVSVLFLGPKAVRNHSARWFMAGICVTAVGRVTHLGFAGTSVGEVWFAWVWCGGVAMVSAAVWHRDMPTIRNLNLGLPNLRRPMAIASITAPFVVGVLVLLAPWATALPTWLGVCTIAVGGVRAVVELSTERDARLDAAYAVQCALHARDTEQRMLYHTISEDIAQTLAIATAAVEDGKAREMTLLASYRAKSLLEGLRPVITRVHELPESVHEVLSVFDSTTKWEFTSSWDDSDWHLASVWPIVKEAAVNVAKHSQAENAWVTLSRNDSWSRVLVGDDGVGLCSQSSHMGLDSIRSIVHAAGGVLTIHTPEQGGTVIDVLLPRSHSKTSAPP
jgi:signal transduction histidine kinase